MRTRNPTILLVAIVLIAVVPARGQEAQVAIPNSISRTLQASSSGRSYRLSIGLPTDYSTSGRAYPVLYVLDANGLFGITVEMVRYLVINGETTVQPIIVGIGYPEGTSWMSARALDLTPTKNPAYERQVVEDWGGEPPEGTGGAGDFLAFIIEDVIPAIEAEFRVNSSDRALHGHSLGGLFALYVLFQHPESFGRYLISSPAKRWDKYIVWVLERSRTESSQSLPASLFLTAAELEEPAGDEAWAPYKMVSNVLRLDSLLTERAYDGLQWMTRVYPDETHNSVIPAALTRGLRWHYGPD